mgnify:CR=1 FL=1
MTFQLSIISLEKIEYRDKVMSVTCPGAEGELTVLENHIPLITPLKKGDVVIRKNDGDEVKITVTSGILEVKKDETVLLISK